MRFERKQVDGHGRTQRLIQRMRIVRKVQGTIFQGEMPRGTCHGNVARVATKPPFRKLAAAVARPIDPTPAAVNASRHNT